MQSVSTALSNNRHVTEGGWKKSLANEKGGEKRVRLQLKSGEKGPQESSSVRGSTETVALLHE